MPIFLFHASCDRHSGVSEILSSYQILPRSRSIQQISNTSLIIIAFSVAFYARIITSLTPIPAALNHAHLILVPAASLAVLMTARTVNEKQIRTTWALLGGLFCLMTISLASALLNNAGMVNAVFLFLMLGEPFLLLAAIIALPLSKKNVWRLRQWVIGSSFVNMVAALIQWPLINAGLLWANGFDATDGMAGVFFVSGAGNYVSATVSLYFAFYYFTAKGAPLWQKLLIFCGAALQFQLADAKQVLLAFFLGWVMLALFNLRDIRKFLIQIVTIALTTALIVWCIHNVEIFSAFKNYADKQGAYGAGGAATQIKLAPFSVIPTYYESVLNWFLGLGPGHTVGRLGGWLLWENWNVLSPLGATVHSVSGELWTMVYDNWIAVESTLFSPFFGWAGIWGDLGLLGIGAYLFLGIVVLKDICVTSFCRFLVLSVAAFGLIFTQMEEPGFMLYCATILGIQWHEQNQ